MVKVRFSGETACFTQPQHKVERVSYPVATPSACVCMLNAIMWKPEMKWQVRRISVLKPIRYLTMKRNELNNVITSLKPIDITNMAHRSQRSTMMLMDVCYDVEAEAILTPKGAADGENTRKYEEMLMRRVKHGQCFRTPYLGCSECRADFGEADDSMHPINMTMDIGPMFFGRFYPDDAIFMKNPDDPKWKKAVPFFFHAKIVSGVVNVPTRSEIMGEYA